MEPQPPAVSTQKPDVAAKHGADRRTSARLFVGIKIAPEIAGELAKIANAVADPLVRRIPATDLHLTLVAPWNEEDIAAATQALTAVLKPIRSFDLAFEHVAYGPTRDRPKLLWTECAPTPELAVLGKLLSLAFHQIDNRPSRPHVTLARLGENGPRIARKYPLDRALSLRQKVRSIELFRSTQQQGRGYEIIASVPLHEEALDMSDPATDISRHVWETKYRYVSPGMAEHSINDRADALPMLWRRLNLRIRRNRKGAFAPCCGSKFLPGGHPGRRRYRPQRHAVQLLRDRHDQGFDPRHFFCLAEIRDDDAARRRNWLRFLDLAAAGHGGAVRRRRLRRAPSLSCEFGFKCATPFFRPAPAVVQ